MQNSGIAGKVVEKSPACSKKREVKKHLTESQKQNHKEDLKEDLKHISLEDFALVQMNSTTNNM